MALGVFTELHFLYSNTSIDGKPLQYSDFLHLIFFLLGFLTICSIYYIEKWESRVLSLANIALQKEIDERKQIEKEREKLISELQMAMGEVKKLSGFLPICSSCKNIRDDEGYWNQIENYIRDHSEAEFSHSICPECVKKLYSDLEVYDDE
jgi:DNA repair exonuclease SbcCD ATPase subunit